MAVGFADTYWDESRSNASDSDTESDKETQVLLFFIRNTCVSLLLSSKKLATTLLLANLCSLCNLHHSTSVLLLR